MKPVKNFLPLVVTLTLLMAIGLAISTYYINYWPTDSYNPYIPTAKKLFTQPFLSDMHTIPPEGMLRLIMRGKEALILGIALCQHLLGDYESLFPNILLLIIATGVSAVLIYLIGQELFSPGIGLIGYALFSFSFWPYMYILQGAHQPLALMNFLWALLFLLKAQKYYYFYLLSGIFLGLTCFSSPTAMLYLIYWIAFFLYQEIFVKKHTRQSLGVHLILVALGWGVIFLLFTWPHPGQNIQGFLAFCSFSRDNNNFVLYKDYLQTLMPLPPTAHGAGLIWVWRYMVLIMPFLFLIYIGCLGYLFDRAWRRPFLLALITLSLSTPIFMELSRVPQFGRNYFSWFISIIGIICFSLDDYRKNKLNTIRAKQWRTKLILGGLALILAAHFLHNIRLFLSDVLPSSLATTKIHRWLTDHHQNQVYVYARHPRNKNFVQFLNNPKDKKKITFIAVDNIRQALDGYILVPPMTGKSIFQDCRLKDFDEDNYLTELYYTQGFSKYAAASFKTLASSKIWVQEEEICTYTDLILKAIGRADREKGLAYLLDAKKLQQEWFSRFPETLKVVTP